MRAVHRLARRGLSLLAAGVTLGAVLATPARADVFKVLGWNDLGMHCMDADYSVFSILPPYNNLHAQVVNATTGKLVTSGVTVSFEATPDLEGSVNSFSAGKTNFWTYARPLFGVDLAPEMGLAGFATAGLTPQAMSFDAGARMWAAPGVPITPVDDAGAKNTYPMVRVTARDAAGNLLGEGHVVLPVSDEMTCVACHGSGATLPDAMPRAGWLNDPRGSEIDYRRNVLARHDDTHGRQFKYRYALRKAGYDARGLLATADAGKPVLCAACHASNALPGTGLKGVSALTAAVHTRHSTVTNPVSGLPLGSEADRGACYMCHPGSETKCLRGVMGNAVLPDGSAAMQCQSCHSTMAKVGAKTRTGWLQQPNCQGCHHNGRRELVAVDANGLPKDSTDRRFATTPNVPSQGFSLYRMSTGHGGLQCEACHGATHAEYTSSHAADNVQSQEVQGHVGTIAECNACHQSVPFTVSGGPHGLHTVGAAWVSRHKEHAEGNLGNCAYCHGADFRGSPLATVKQARLFFYEGRPVSYAAGQQVTCYDCHRGPGGDRTVAVRR